MIAIVPYLIVFLGYRSNSLKAARRIAASGERFNQRLKGDICSNCANACSHSVYFATGMASASSRAKPAHCGIFGSCYSRWSRRLSLQSCTVERL